MRKKEKKLALPILMYHHVAPINYESKNPDLYVSPEQFDLQLKYISEKGYTTIHFQDLLDHWEKNVPLPRKAVIITFDDGFENNYLHAFPLMKKYDAKGTIFLVTDFIGNFYTWSKNTSNPPEKLLSWDQINEMHKYGIKFGSHACTHKDLTKISEAEAYDQLKFSKEILEEKLKTKINVLTYPYGSYNTDIIEIAKKAGYECACSTIRGNRHTSKEKYTLKRVMIHHDTTIKRFQYYLTRLYDLEHTIKSKRKKRK
ncbi:polysaccharide deacetylase family protein [bacterium]|nr:polysaccharide deacetylase family protein [bacterium]